MVESQQGTTVSPAHSRFVMEETKSAEKSIQVITAGVDLELFQTGKRSAQSLAYHGRVDVHRGVLSLPMILAGLHSQGVKQLYTFMEQEMQ